MARRTSSGLEAASSAWASRFAVASYIGFVKLDLPRWNSAGSGVYGKRGLVIYSPFLFHDVTGRTYHLCFVSIETRSAKLDVGSTAECNRSGVAEALVLQVSSLIVHKTSQEESDGDQDEQNRDNDSCRIFKKNIVDRRTGSLKLS